MKRALVMASLLLFAAPGHATVKAGIAAWQKGDYDRAVSIWRNLATKADPDAAFNLGQAYRLGRGVPADSRLARFWFERAARRNHLEATVPI